MRTSSSSTTISNEAALENNRGIVAWFVKNPVAANLLMILIIAAGLMSAFTIKKRMFPDFATNIVQVAVVYPGAGTLDIEQSILLKVEESLRDIQGIKEVKSLTWEGYGQVQAELESGYDIDQLYDDVKTAVDGITNLPGDAEDPVVTKLEPNEQVLFVGLYGDIEQLSLQRSAQELQAQLLTLPEVLSTNLIGDEELEISIQISEASLREYGLTFDEIAKALRGSSIDVAGGSLKTNEGDIAVKTRGQAYKGIDFADVVIRTNTDGSRLLLSEIATIYDGFEEDSGLFRFNGQNTTSIEIVSETQSNDLKTSEAVREFLKEYESKLPEGISVQIWGDTSYYLEGRIDMMMENMLFGAILVFLLLSLFLRIRVAIWVIVGIPVCFFGAIWLMPNGLMPVSINMLSLFAFILVLGIVVDDAIIIGESVYTQVSRHGHTTNNVIIGVNKVIVPATFGVLTTMVAFLPLLFVEGRGAPFFESITLVVIFCLFFSLVESKIILPAHLAHMKNLDQNQESKTAITKLQDRFSIWFEAAVERYYMPLIQWVTINRYVTIAAFFGVMIVLGGVINSPLIRFSFFPKVPSEYVQVSLAMTSGSTIEQRNNALTRLEQAMLELDQEYRDKDPKNNGLYESINIWSQGDNEGKAFVELTKNESRSLSPMEVEEQWREKTGEIPGIQKLTFSAAKNAGGSK
ncbi:MAG: efflux RND transporter permease subunit, partial [Endozoicomonas sp.]